MDSKELVRCALQIEKFNAERSFGNISALLVDLERSGVTSEQLEFTDVVKVLYKVLKTCPDQRVKRTARSLLAKWKRQYKKVEERETPEEGGVEDHDSGSSSEQFVNDTTKEAPSGSSDSVRSKCVLLLLAALRPEPPDEEKAAALCGDIERRLHELHAPNRLKYKACVRSKVANLRNPKSAHLRKGLLSGALSPEDFAAMSAEEMAGTELRRLREEISNRGVSERQLPGGVEGTPTRKVRCQRCGGSDCSVTQVSRGALFLPAWVRQSGPDDDAMTYMTCRSCGQQWYHSGWVCL